MSFHPAVKRQSKLRAAIIGPSGAGHTMTALRIAAGLAGPDGRVALIDSENGSASKYADRFTFDTQILQRKGADDYIEAIDEADRAGYQVLIIDGLFHAWQELLEEVDQLSATKYRGNSSRAWADVAPKKKRLIQTVLGYSGHVIATLRSATEWQSYRTVLGKVEQLRVGLAPQQEKGIEYDFDFVLEMTADHTGRVIKDRDGMLQDEIIKKPGEKLGQDLRAWLDAGEPAIINQVPAKYRAPSGAAPRVVEIYQAFWEYITSGLLTPAGVEKLETVMERKEVNIAVLEKGLAKAKQAHDEKVRGSNG